MNNNQDLKRLVEAGDTAGALALLEALIAAAPEDDSLYFERGKLYWRLGERSKATGDYLRAAALNPDSPAAVALEHAGDIEEFFNPDLLNP